MTELKQSQQPAIVFWSKGGESADDPALKESAATMLAFEPSERFYAGRLKSPTDGLLVIQLTSPRPLRLWIGHLLVIDESLPWRTFQRELRCAATLPVRQGETAILVEAGARPMHPKFVDDLCTSRNRDRALAALEQTRPDRLILQLSISSEVTAPSISLRFVPNQFVRDGVVYQHILARTIRGADSAPRADTNYILDDLPETLRMSSSIRPGYGTEITNEADLRANLRRFCVPIEEVDEPAAPLRNVQEIEQRYEPVIEIARTLQLKLEGNRGGITLEMPGYESLGKLAPQREYREIHWPTAEELLAKVPELILPPQFSAFGTLYQEAWRMLLRLTKPARPESGIPNSYIGTGAAFNHYQFVWDTSFTAMASAYGCRGINPYATLDLLYSRQFDGGYIHREFDVRDGMPIMYEPDFSPNPPVMSVAEWQLYRVTGNSRRIKQIYCALKSNHTWLQKNRQLTDGTYWTTGLANGLDNSPSLGDGYPDLTAQMAHEAEILGNMAKILGHDRDADQFSLEYARLRTVINQKLWSDKMGFYSTSLPYGGYNPNKVVTGFWPLWAGCVPSERAELLAKQLKDPAAFWRHHPVPSLAADSPLYQPNGHYWLGSTWAPTNFMVIQGFDRAGRHDLALETTIRHLTCMAEVLAQTGYIWENYCAERSERGNWSGPEYCWSAAGPIALLIEVIIGIRVDAPTRTIHWQPLPSVTIGARKLPFGDGTVTLWQRFESGRTFIHSDTNVPFTLKLKRINGNFTSHLCPVGSAEFEVENP